MEIKEERRITKQIPEYDEDGRISFYKIPNYIKREKFLEDSERKFFRVLLNIIPRLNNRKEKRYIQISTQVAINRIIDINNRRNTDLYEEIKDKSIDYVLFDLNTSKIMCCIELQGKEHFENEERIKRDILIRKIFKESEIKYIEIKTQNEYNENEIYNEIVNN